MSATQKMWGERLGRIPHYLKIMFSFIWFVVTYPFCKIWDGIVYFYTELDEIAIPLTIVGGAMSLVATFFMVITYFDMKTEAGPSYFQGLSVCEKDLATKKLTQKKLVTKGDISDFKDACNDNDVSEKQLEYLESGK